MKNSAFRLVFLLLLLAAIGMAIQYRDQLDIDVLQQWIDAAGIAGPLLFMSIYALGTVLFLPGSVMTLAGGALFGPVLGTLYNLTGATAGAALAFLPRLVARMRLGATLSIDDLGRRLSSSEAPLLLDVRTSRDFATGHIDAARNIPLEDLATAIVGLAEHRQRPIAIICITDRRSRAAAGMLLNKGFENVKIVRGGMKEWKKRLLPVTSGT